MTYVIHSTGMKGFLAKDNKTITSDILQAMRFKSPSDATDASKRATDIFKRRFDVYDIPETFNFEIAMNTQLD